MYMRIQTMPCTNIRIQSCSSTLWKNIEDETPFTSASAWSDGLEAKEPGARRVRELVRSAERPLATQRIEPTRKRAKTTSSPQSVAFIACGEEGQDFTTSFRRRALLRAVRHALDAGATIINIAFHRIVSGDLVDPETMLPELQSEFDATWIFRSIGSVISFFSESCGTLLSEDILDPEGFPALMLTFIQYSRRVSMHCHHFYAKPPIESKSAHAE